MKTLILYDDSGVIWSTMAGSTIPGHCAVLLTDIPDGKLAERVDLDTGEVILIDIPLTDEQQSIETLKKAAMVTAASFTDEQAADVPSLYPEWKAGETVCAGDRRYRPENGRLYKVIQSHTAQAGWEPENAPALWAEVV